MVYAEEYIHITLCAICTLYKQFSNRLFVFRFPGRAAAHHVDKLPGDFRCARTAHAEWVNT